MIGNETINNIPIEDYCKQHCESCIHNCVCDIKNKDGLVAYFKGLKVSKNNSALFDDVEFECPYHKEIETQLEIGSSEFLIATFAKENNELKTRNKRLKSSNEALLQKVKALESIRNSLNYLLKCEKTKNEVLNSLIKYLKNEVKENG